MKLVLVLLSLLSICSKTEAAPTFGRYLGVLRHANIAQDQLARLDFITEQEAGGILKLRASLVLYFGGFESDEYASYDYDNVSYNLLTGTLVFDTPERELHFVVSEFKPGDLKAELKTGTGSVGQLIMTQDDSVTPERPLVQPLWGEYRGVCDNVGERIQIQTTPPGNITTNRTDRFAPFGIHVQRGENGSSRCLHDAGTCITAVFNDADYDFFNGHIDLHGRSGSLACQIDQSGLICGQCQFKRSSTDAAVATVYLLKNPVPDWQVPTSAITPTSGIAGTYDGFVHLEGRDQYQPFSLAITTYRQSPDGGSGETLMVSVVANVKFGGHSATDETISTKFDPRPLNIMNAQPVLDREDHASDMILKITNIDSGVIEGEWHSRRFAKVGRFIVRANGPINLGADTKLAPDLTGNYDNGDWNVSLQVVFSDAALNSKDPFSPLAVQGWARFSDITPRMPITESAYDPFTGKFWLTFNEHGDMIGRRTDHAILMKRPATGILRAMQPHPFIELPEVKP